MTGVLKNTDKFKKTLGVALEENLSIKLMDFAESTATIYRRKTKQLQRWIGKYVITEITATFMEQKICSWRKKYSPKTVNAYLDPLRATFNRAVRDGIIKCSPLEGVKTCKWVPKSHDAFSKAEIERLTSEQAKYPIEVAMINIGTHTGLRASELLALSVESIDIMARRIKIDLSLVDGKYKIPKTTESERHVDIPDCVLKDIEFLVENASKRKPKTIEFTLSDNRTRAKLTRHFIAFCVKENRLYRSVDYFRDKFFKPYCESVSVRYRGPSQFRHTFTSQLLTGGVAIEWIAIQLGHTSTAMIRKHYGKWLENEAVNIKQQVNQVWAGGTVTDNKQNLETESYVAKKDTITPQSVDSGSVCQSMAPLVDLNNLVKNNPMIAMIINSLINSYGSSTPSSVAGSQLVPSDLQAVIPHVLCPSGNDLSGLQNSTGEQ